MAIVLENHMLGRQFVLGDQVTVADFVLAYTLDWANEIQLLATFPTLAAYMEQMTALVFTHQDLPSLIFKEFV